jgi:hypothetical protein
MNKQEIKKELHALGIQVVKGNYVRKSDIKHKIKANGDISDKWDTAVDNARQAIYDLERFVLKNATALENELDLNIPPLKQRLSLLTDMIKQF